MTICSVCGSTETYIKPRCNKPYWPEFKGKIYCRSCYRKLLRRLVKDPNPHKCECNCGELIYNTGEEYVRFIKSHNTKGEFNGHYGNGTRYINDYKYILKADHPYAGDYGYVAEHRLIMETFLERYLTPDEEIDHFNENKLDNHITNLILTNNSDHQKRHYNNRKIDPKTGRFLSKCDYLGILS